MNYDFSSIEKKWQEKWEADKAFKTEINDKPKYYTLEMFPYPSGNLHMGHVRNYSIGDVVARFKKMNGFNVLHPMGWDSFGLPAENAAIKHGANPKDWTLSNIDNMRDQLKSLGISYDWDREIATCKPDYYKFTQKLFLEFFNHGLAYKKKSYVNWCPSCQTVLANEQVVNGKCERCKAEVGKKDLEQWFFKITEYADELLQDLDKLKGWPDKVKTMQANWIGKSHGAQVDFKLDGSDTTLTVYTTRPDTIYGVTFMVMAPEHPLLDKYVDKISNMDEVLSYRAECAKKTEFERTQLVKDKTGVKINGITAKNPASGKDIPIYISDYVMMGYGTGAIMAVPAHDDRDYDFAKKFGIDIVEVIKGGDISEAAYTGDGEMVNSDFLNGMDNKKDSIAKMIEFLSEKGIGEGGVQFKMKDWAFNRQRYWGEPIPIVQCEKCGMVAVPYDQLPLRLPEVENFEPGTDGESPLAKIDSYVNCKCPKCGGDAKRETDTMLQWAGSSWYFLRYIDPNNDSALADMEKLNYWMPVDWYNGGMEHVTRHLIYSRFWHKFLYDIGAVPCAEPYAKRTAQGLILGPDGVKMSKSRGNVIDPNEVVDSLGADVLRTYVLFMGDYEQAAPWSENSVKGCKRFIDRIWNLQEILVDGDEYSKELSTSFHKTIKKVSEDIETLKYNTAIAALMTLLNSIYTKGEINKAELKTFLLLVNPFAPHITEEMWEQCGFGEMLAKDGKWPVYDEAKCCDSEIEIVVQICGKIKAKLMVATDASKDDMLLAAKEAVANELNGKQIIKEIVVPGKLVNIVAK